MSNFTKGKWFLGSYETKAGKHRKIEVVAGVKVSEGAIKRIACISGTDAESRANARLIASAPELYEAVCDLLDYAYDIIIIDSLSHAWNGQGGLLDLQSKLIDTKYRGNSYNAWKDITPLQNQLVDALISSKCHIIATMRSKTEYIQTENERGRTEIRKVGLAPVQREGIDYEFGTVFDLSQNHMAMVSKDRTGLFDEQVFTVSQDTGKLPRKWLEDGAEIMKGDKAFS